VEILLVAELDSTELAEFVEAQKIATKSLTRRGTPKEKPSGKKTKRINRK